MCLGNWQFIGIENRNFGILRFYIPVINSQSALSEHFTVGYQQFGTAVAQHEVQALSGVGRIQRHIGTACCQYAQGCDSEPLVAGNQNAYDILLGQSGLGDFLCYTTSLSHHVTIGVAHLIIYDCNILRRHGGLMQD